MRQIGVRYGGLVDESYELISLLDDFDQVETKDDRIQEVIDQIRDKFDFIAIQKATVYLEGSRNIARSNP